MLAKTNVQKTIKYLTEKLDQLVEVVNYSSELTITDKIKKKALIKWYRIEIAGYNWSARRNCETVQLERYKKYYVDRSYTVKGSYCKETKEVAWKSKDYITKVPGMIITDLCCGIGVVDDGEACTARGTCTPGATVYGAGMVYQCPTTENLRSHEAAVAYCSALVLNDKSDWYLPSSEKYRKVPSAIVTAFSSPPTSYYAFWMSTKSSNQSCVVMDQNGNQVCSADAAFEYIRNGMKGSACACDELCTTCVRDMQNDKY